MLQYPLSLTLVLDLVVVVLNLRPYPKGIPISFSADNARKAKVGREWLLCQHVLSGKLKLEKHNFPLELAKVAKISNPTDAVMDLS